MDIQRKSFESSNNVNPDWSFKFDEGLQQYVATDFEMTNQVEEFNEHWDTFRAGWQAAKAQAVPEANALLGATLDAVQKLGSGDFVLVPVIDIELAIEALDEAGEGESKYYAGCADGLRKALESLEKNNGN